MTGETAAMDGWRAGGWDIQPGRLETISCDRAVCRGCGQVQRRGRTGRAGVSLNNKHTGQANPTHPFSLAQTTPPPPCSSHPPHPTHRDIAPEQASLADTNRALQQVAEVALELQKGSAIRPLWGTAQLFKHPRYMHGAATSGCGNWVGCMHGLVDVVAS